MLLKRYPFWIATLSVVLLAWLCLYQAVSAGRYGPCVNGQCGPGMDGCIPNRKNFGYYAAKWRKWPGDGALVEGEEALEGPFDARPLPAIELPEPKDEGQVRTPQTRGSGAVDESLERPAGPDRAPMPPVDPGDNAPMPPEVPGGNPFSRPPAKPKAAPTFPVPAEKPKTPNLDQLFPAPKPPARSGKPTESIENLFPAPKPSGNKPPAAKQPEGSGAANQPGTLPQGPKLPEISAAGSPLDSAPESRNEEIQVRYDANPFAPRRASRTNRQRPAGVQESGHRLNPLRAGLLELPPQTGVELIGYDQPEKQHVPKRQPAPATTPVDLRSTPQNNSAADHEPGRGIRHSGAPADSTADENGALQPPESETRSTIEAAPATPSLPRNWQNPLRSEPQPSPIRTSQRPETSRGEDPQPSGRSRPERQRDNPLRP